MRLWSLHPKYLDTKGLIALWRESLLAQSVLLKGEYTECPRCEGVGWGLIDKAKDNVKYNDCPKCNGKGKIKTPYYNHPQLKRFKNCPSTKINCIDEFRIIKNPYEYIQTYLFYIWEEANNRSYDFDINKISGYYSKLKLTVTKGQLIYEFNHLQNKLYKRNFNKWNNNNKNLHLSSDRGIFPFVFLKPHPLFKVIDGNVESWEKIKGKNLKNFTKE